MAPRRRLPPHRRNHWPIHAQRQQTLRRRPPANPQMDRPKRPTALHHRNRRRQHPNAGQPRRRRRQLRRQWQRQLLRQPQQQRRLWPARRRLRPRLRRQLRPRLRRAKRRQPPTTAHAEQTRATTKQHRRPRRPNPRSGQLRRRHPVLNSIYINYVKIHHNNQRET